MKFILYGEVFVIIIDYTISGEPYLQFINFIFYGFTKQLFYIIYPTHEIT
jgi:hypothetical protein